MTERYGPIVLAADPAGRSETARELTFERYGRLTARALTTERYPWFTPRPTSCIVTVDTPTGGDLDV